MNKAERAKAPTGLERRAYPVSLEVRAGSTAGTSTIEGYASVVEQGYQMWDWLGEYTEVVRSGAFTRTLNANPQVQLLLNHGGLSMAYTRAGTLALAEDSTGLHIKAEVNTKRSDVGDMVAALADGNVDEMSFAFRCTRQQWSPDFDQRDIQEVDIHRGDVSVVNFGANPATSAALRSQDFDRMSPDAARALMARLEKRIQVVVVDTDPEDDDECACAGCGAMNDTDAAYCDQCGAPMTTDSPAAGSMLSALSADLDRLEVVKPRLILA